jgi:hypothetical protein
MSLLALTTVVLLGGFAVAEAVAVAADENDTADAEATAKTPVAVVAAATGWMQGCRQQGFDPAQLACVTCNLMPTQAIKATCLSCCQSYKDVVLTGGGRFDKPHQAAILVLPKGMPVPEEVQKLLTDDWQQLVESKGGGGGARGARLFSMELNAQVSASNSHMRFLFAAPPAYIYFFDDKDISAYRTATSVATIADAAKESVSLQGWKREDIKDMLQTMLP